MILAAREETADPQTGSDGSQGLHRATWFNGTERSTHLYTLPISNDPTRSL